MHDDLVDAQAGLSDDPLRTLVEVIVLVLHLPLLTFIFFYTNYMVSFYKKDNTSLVCLITCRTFTFIEPCHEKICHQDFRRVPIQTRLCNQDC